MTRSAPVLVLDVGTSSVRGTLVGDDGEFLALRSRPLTLTSMSPGAAEENAEDWWAGCIAVLSELAPLCGGAPAAITVTNQQITTVPVDAQGEALAPAMVWMDQRPGDIVAALPPLVREHIHRATGIPASSSWSIARALWWRETMPESNAKIDAYLTVDAFVYDRLCGRRVTDPSNACFGMMDLRSDAYDTELATLVGIDIRTLPDIVPSGTVVGTLLPEVAAQVGMGASTPIIVSGSDQACAALGMGVVSSSEVGVTTGTGTFVVRPSQEVLVDERFMTNRSVTTLPYLVMGLHYVSGAAWNWFVDTVDTAGMGRSRTAEQLLGEIWSRDADRPAPVLAPYFSGARSPLFDDAATATWAGMTLSTTRADLGYSVLESNGFGARQIIDALDDAYGEAAAVIRLAGGPSASEHWCQLQADASGLPCSRAANSEATTLGAALVVLAGLGRYPSVEDAAVACVTQSARFAPHAARAPRFAARRDAYRDLYHRTTALMKGIA